jgi:hypothetical protein
MDVAGQLEQHLGHFLDAVERFGIASGLVVAVDSDDDPHARLIVLYSKALFAGSPDGPRFVRMKMLVDHLLAKTSGLIRIEVHSLAHEQWPSQRGPYAQKYHIHEVDFVAPRHIHRLKLATGRAKAASAHKCPVCESATRYESVTFVYRRHLNKSRVWFANVHAHVCWLCGQCYYPADVSRELRDRLREALSAAGPEVSSVGRGAKLKP